METSQLIYIANNRGALSIKVESWLMIIVSLKKKRYRENQIDG